jgi:hypothetical protein
MENLGEEIKSYKWKSRKNSRTKKAIVKFLTEFI